MLIFKIKEKTTVNIFPTIGLELCLVLVLERTLVSFITDITEKSPINELFWITLKIKMLVDNLKNLE